MEDIPAQLILNWDQTGIKIVPSTTWTTDRRGVKRVEMIGVNDKKQITAVFCCSLVGEFLPIQIIYAGKTARCHPKFNFPVDCHITTVQYIDSMILPYVAQVRDTLKDKENAALIIMDNFRGQITPAINTLLEKNNIHVCFIPPNTTDLLQPLDISVINLQRNFLKENLNSGTQKGCWSRYKNKILIMFRLNQSILAYQ